MKLLVIFHFLTAVVSIIKTQDLIVTEMIDDVLKTFFDPLRTSQNPQTLYSYEMTTEISSEGTSPSSEIQSFSSDVTKKKDVTSIYSTSSSDYSSTSLESTSGSMSSPSIFTSSLLPSSTFSTNIFSESTSDSKLSSTDIPTLMTETDEIMELTSKFHMMRVNYTRSIHAQQIIIAKLTETIRSLQRDVAKLKLTNDREMNKMRLKNENCRIDFNWQLNELKVVKKLFAIEKYSDGLKRKLSEFGVNEVTNQNSSKTVLKFSIFEMESDKFSGKILSNRQLYVLPPRIGEIVANVSEFSATNVGLVAINQNAFEGMNRLRVLNLSNNEISLLETGNFGSLVELRKLDLSYNKINTIEVNAFDGLKELEELNVKNNLIVKVPFDTFDTLLNLKILDFSHNLIRELSEETFTVINVIEEFYIDNNQLISIHPNIISDFEVSKVLDFRANMCIDTRFPDNLTMVQLAIEISEKCWMRKHFKEKILSDM